MKNIYTIHQHNVDAKDEYFVSIGKKSPWNNKIQIPVPEVVANFVAKYLTNQGKN